MAPQRRPKGIRTRKGRSTLPSSKSSKSNNSCSLSLIVIYSIVCSVFLYVFAMVSLTQSLNSTPASQSALIEELQRQRLAQELQKDPKTPKEDDAPIPDEKVPKQDPAPVKIPNMRATEAEPRKKEETGDGGKPKTKGGKREWGHGVKPQLLRTGTNERKQLASEGDATDDPNRPILTAFLEPIDRKSWKKRPLPIRTSTEENLETVAFPQLKSCSKLPEQWPIDNYPDADPFLPWIHDVFPTHDGRFLQFVAQNKRRCHTGTTTEDIQTLAHTEPQIALFQHVAVQRVSSEDEVEGRNSPRYKLVPHDLADPDGLDTRFICRFSNGEETLSVYNFNYEWASTRKRQRKIFSEEGRDNKLIHTSQLTFQCPIPESLVETVRTGSSVQNDYATIFVDLIPMRTPPRYGSPTAFMPPYYKDFQAKGDDAFDPIDAWGTDHILPRVEDSGRWSNIPICKPSLLTYGKQAKDDEAITPAHEDGDPTKLAPVKQHNLVSCLWASTGYTTRGNRFAINDGQRRLLEFISYNKLIGVDHFYLYDNSGAFSTDPEHSLHPIAELFPDDVTIIDWPAQVCNNNPNNVDSVGERSSQYAAEASCRLRFGPHVEWIAQFDLDEYLVPMGEHESILPVLDKLDKEGNKIISFGSWRAWPRRRFIETPEKVHGKDMCGKDKDCFQLRIPLNYTMLQSYNCDRQKPGEKTKQMPAEKQIYRPDYVKHHFIHYSTVTGSSVLNKKDIQAQGMKWIAGSAFPDPLSRFGDELTEALMLHTKAVATQDTIDWETACNAGYEGKAMCRLGTPFEENMTPAQIANGDEGWQYNCYVNHKIDDYWVPRLEADLKDHIPEMVERLAKEA